MVKGRPDYNRGKIEILILSKAIRFNGNLIRKAKIEIDHINYGLNKVTRTLNKTKRTNFTLKDIEKFIKLLDGETIIPGW